VKKLLLAAVATLAVSSAQAWTYETDDGRNSLDHSSRLRRGILRDRDGCWNGQHLAHLHEIKRIHHPFLRKLGVVQRPMFVMHKHRRLAKIWRAIARRWRDAHLRTIVIAYHADDEDYEI
jgi:hypothetical protein